MGGLARFAFLPALSLMGCSPAQRVYSHDCNIPPSSFGTAEDGIGHLRPIAVVKIGDNGSIRWAGKPIALDGLSAILSEWDRLNPTPHLILEAEPAAPCSEVERVRSLMAATESCKAEFRLCSEGHDPERWRQVGGP